MGRRIPPDRKHCARGHPWVPENIHTTMSQRTGMPLRRCRVCLREDARKGSKSRKAKHRKERGDKSVYDPVTRRKVMCKNGHPLDGGNVLESTDRGRVVRKCAICRRQKQAGYRHLRLAAARSRRRIKQGAKKAATTRRAKARVSPTE
jgi:hypothetical protein